jgi:tRNA (guanine37-N1)-methyltransferase
MRFDIISLFPQMLAAYFSESIIGRAQASDRIAIQLHDLREHGVGRHRITDEPPFGGGGGMILRPDPLFAAVEAISPPISPTTPIILLTPQGRTFTQAVAAELMQHDQLVLICGRYEGFDERVRQNLVTDEISIGDFVLTGGEIGAMVLVDAVTRLLPGALGAALGAVTDSHATGLLEGAHYTKPVNFRGWEVPPLLRSGNNVKIERWHREDALRRTWQRRPDLLLTATLSVQDQQFLATLAQESLDKNSSPIDVA